MGIPGFLLEGVGLSEWVKKCLGPERPPFLGSVLLAHGRKYRPSRDSFVSPVNTQRLGGYKKNR